MNTSIITDSNTTKTQKVAGYTVNILENGLVEYLENETTMLFESISSFEKFVNGDITVPYAKKCDENSREFLILNGFVAPKPICIGLFGTCGGSTWRNNFMKRYEEQNINFFNPQVDDWDPSMAKIEADHLANDEIILFPITSETYGLGSLAETGFSILQAIKLEKNRDFVLLIDEKPDASLESDAVTYKESCRARALVLEHLRKLQISNVYLVETLDEMLEVSLHLHTSAVEKAKLNRFALK